VLDVVCRGGKGKYLLFDLVGKGNRGAQVNAYTVPGQHEKEGF